MENTNLEPTSESSDILQTDLTNGEEPTKEDKDEDEDEDDYVGSIV